MVVSVPSGHIVPSQTDNSPGDRMGDAFSGPVIIIVDLLNAIDIDHFTCSCFTFYLLVQVGPQLDSFKSD